VAEKAGLQVGDRVLAVDGDPAANWEAVLNRVEAAKGQPLTVSVQRGTERLELIVAVPAQRRDVQGLPAKVARVVPGEAGDRAGMKAGDKVVAFNGERIEIWPDLVRRARRSPSRPIPLTVERDGRPVDLQITPGTRPDETGTGQIGYLGIEVDQAQEPVTVQREEWNIGVGPRIESIPIHRSLMARLERTWWVGDLTLRVLGRLATGDISPKAIGGPLYIAAEAGKQA
jgi:regulator of sigma E protease